MEVHPPSLDWIWNSIFAEWLKSDEKIFWIAGKPASGKSTLVNYIAQHHNTLELVRTSLGDRAAIARFFFDFRAESRVPNNFEGLRRSLLYQLLERLNIAESTITNYLGLAPKADLSDAHWAKVFHFVLDKNGGSILLFLDGLDEYAGEKPDLMSLIKEITDSGAKVCVSSRNELPFSDKYERLKWKLYMDQVNKEGIETYARDRLTNTVDIRDDDERKALEDAAKSISEHSLGVFLWARFAVSDVSWELTLDRKLEYTRLQKIIERVHPDLEERYSRILKSLKPDLKHACGVILQLLDAAKEALQLSELFEAAYLADVRLPPFGDSLESEDLARFGRHLGVLAGGVIETVPDPSMEDRHIQSHKVSAKAKRTVLMNARMIHRTLKTFLDKKGWIELFGKPPSPGCQQVLWIKVCRSFFAGNRVKWNSKSLCTDDCGNIINIEKAIPTRSPELVIPIRTVQKYAHRNFLDHAESYEQETNHSCRALVHDIMSLTWIKHHLAELKDYPIDRPFLGYPWVFHALFGSRMHLAVRHGLKHYLEEELRSSPTAATSCIASFTHALQLRPINSNDNDLWTAQEQPSSETASVSLLATAVFCSASWQFGKSRHAEIIRSLVCHSRRLEDFDMLMAIRQLSLTEIEDLLTQWPKGRLVMRTNLFLHNVPQRFMFHSRFAEHLQEFSYGPLWAVGGRISNSDDTSARLQLFLDRGEDINGQCGPFGSILHSTVAHYLFADDYLWTAFEGIFIDFVEVGDANVHQKGPQGNVLEYAWKEAHSEQRLARRAPQRCDQLIEFLIRIGLNNSVKDPSGEIPSKDRMLQVARKGNPTPEDMSLYYHGTSERSGE